MLSMTMEGAVLLDRMKEVVLLEWVATLDTKRVIASPDKTTAPATQNSTTESPKQAAPTVPHPTADASHQPEHFQTQRLKETPQTSTTPAERAAERLAW